MARPPIEKYFHETDDLEIRQAQTDGSIGQVAGYAIEFNKPSTAAGPFTEYILPGALDDVDLSKVLALYDHDYANVLGRVDADTLVLKIDKVGLHFEMNLPDTTLGRDVYNNVKLGNLKSMSFGFVVAKGGDSWERGEKPIRKINRIEKLKEISVVSIPAYDDTSIQVTRSLDAFLLQENTRYREKVALYLGGSDE